MDNRSMVGGKWDHARPGPRANSKRTAIPSPGSWPSSLTLLGSTCPLHSFGSLIHAVKISRFFSGASHQKTHTRTRRPLPPSSAAAHARLRHNSQPMGPETLRLPCRRARTCNSPRLACPPGADGVPPGMRRLRQCVVAGFIQFQPLPPCLPPFVSVSRLPSGTPKFQSPFFVGIIGEAVTGGLVLLAAPTARVFLASCILQRSNSPLYFLIE